MLKIDSLTVAYDDKVVLQDVSFDVQPGEILALIGPNGTGKSCFCEALEYTLLGSINEAESKRIDIEQYIKNLNTGISEQPILTK